MPRPIMRSLSPIPQRILNRASKKAVSDIFQRSNDCKNGQWLRLANFYLEDTIAKIEQDTNNHSIKNADLGAYLSISGPLHCIDGWTYLSRSLNSLIHGDFHTARHLAYYAELRAAISILATEGIGILNRQHFVIDKNEKCVLIPDNRGTHTIVWPILDYWSQQLGAAELLGSVVKPYGVQLIDWHKEFESATTFPAIAAKWLTSWGLDLHQLNTDHHTRNAISYRPFRILSQAPTIPTDVSKFVKAFWFTFFPSGASKFDELDRYLLNKSLHTAHSALKIGRNYEERVDSTVSNLFSGKPTEVIDSYKAFLSEEQNSAILQYANLQDDLSHPQQVFQMLSRASLLLRLATGASVELLLSSGYSWLDFEFWWKALGNDIGLWELGNEIDVPDDLWEDINNSINEIDKWEKNTASPSTFNLHITNTNAKDLWVLSGTERIALWGLSR
jgi:hypothetical protein